MNDEHKIDKSEAADAKRMRWMLNGNGYFLEHEGLCGHEADDAEQDEARRAIDQGMIDQAQWIHDHREPHLLADGTTVMRDKRTGSCYDTKTGRSIPGLMIYSNHLDPRKLSGD